jgi:hypothetical protein
VLFEEAKAAIIKLRENGYIINNMRDYMNLSKEIRIEYGLPSRPDQFYKEWTNWSDFLGIFVSFEKAKEIIIELKKKGHVINKKEDYCNLPKEVKREYGLPSNPYRFYKEWTNWYDFLGTNKKK